MSRDFLRSLGIISIDCEKRASSQPKMRESEVKTQESIANNLPIINTKVPKGFNMMMTQSIKPTGNKDKEEEVVVR